MDAIRLRKKISSGTLKIQQLKRFIGKTVSIVIYADEKRTPRGRGEHRTPNWIGKYTTDGKLVDERASIYSK